MLQIPEVVEPLDPGDEVIVGVERVQVRAQGHIPQAAERGAHRQPAARPCAAASPLPARPHSPLNALIHEAELAGDPRHAAGPPR